MTFVHNPCMWLTTSSIQLVELSQLNTFLGFFQKRNFLECQETKMS